MESVSGSVVECVGKDNEAQTREANKRLSDGMRAEKEDEGRASDVLTSGFWCLDCPEPAAFS